MSTVLELLWKAGIRLKEGAKEHEKKAFNKSSTFSIFDSKPDN